MKIFLQGNDLCLITPHPEIIVRCATYSLVLRRELKKNTLFCFMHRIICVRSFVPFLEYGEPLISSTEMLRNKQ